MSKLELDKKENENKIILVMIVRNESKIIRRCLDSARSILDAILVCDTGSTDETVSIVEETIKEFKIPGKVLQQQWQSFGHNRTLSFESAQVYAIDYLTKNLKWPLNSCYALFIDADMMLVVKDDFKKKDLTEDGYSLFQHTSSLSYSNLRLARLDWPWKSHRRTHEYWGVSGLYSSELNQLIETSNLKDQLHALSKPETKTYRKRVRKEGSVNLPSSLIPQDEIVEYQVEEYKWDVKQSDLMTLEIDDRDDGGCKSDKYERDLRLLHLDLDDDIDDERSLFYLGQTYKCLQQWENSIAYYRERIRVGGYFKEEIWYSHMTIAECLLHLGKINDAICEYLDAYEVRPERAESLYRLAKLYREMPDKQHLGYLFAKKASIMDYPYDDRLFVERTVYAYEALYELSICGCYCDDEGKRDGFKACEELVLRLDIPDHIAEMSFANEKHYLKPLFQWVTENDKKTITSKHAPFLLTVLGLPKRNMLKDDKVEMVEGSPFVEDPKSNENDKNRYVYSNPSIFSNENGYTLCLRCVNYDHDVKTGIYSSRDKDGIVRTRNFLLRFDSDKNLQANTTLGCLQSCQEIVNNQKYSKYPARVLGIEDMRIFPLGQQVWFTGTTCDTQKSGQPQISLGRLDKSDISKSKKYFYQSIEINPKSKKDQKKDNSGPKKSKGQTNSESKKSENFEKSEKSEKNESETPQSENLNDPKLTVPIYLDTFCPLIGLSTKNLWEASLHPFDSSKIEEEPCEKNWLPFTMDLSKKGFKTQQMMVIYNYDPFTLARIERENNRLIPYSVDNTISARLNVSKFRGSTSPIPFKFKPTQNWKSHSGSEYREGYLFTVHEVLFSEEKRKEKKGEEEVEVKWYKRSYRHRFVFMEEVIIQTKEGRSKPTWTITFVTVPMFIKSNEIEFWSGLCSSTDGQQLIITCGVNDGEAILARFPKRTIERILKPADFSDDDDD